MQVQKIAVNCQIYWLLLGRKDSGKAQNENLTVPEILFAE